MSQLKYLFPSTGCTEAFCQTEVTRKNLLFTNFQSVAVLIYNGRISGCGNLCKEVIRNNSLETTAMVFLWSALRADLSHHLFLSVISTLTFVWFPIFRSYWVKTLVLRPTFAEVWIWTFDVCHRNFCARNYHSITFRWLCCSYHIMWENHAIFYWKRCQHLNKFQEGENVHTKQLMCYIYIYIICSRNTDFYFENQEL